MEDNDLKAKMDKETLARLEAYLRKTFGSPAITVRGRPKMDDSAEVFVGDDFLATITIDDDEGDLAYQFQMAILAMDLEDA